jgi:ADP-heptose:LPS heptosyltransferase
MSQYNRMLVAAPERWDDACFAVPAVRALVASGLRVGVMCGTSQMAFWQTLRGIEVSDAGTPLDAAAWDAALAWEDGPIARAIRKSGVTRRIAPTSDRKLGKWSTDAAEIHVDVLEHRVRYFLATVEALGVRTDDKAFFAAVERPARPQDGVMLCADSDFGPSHEWPLDRWVELARWLAGDCGLRISVVGLDGVRELGARLAAELGEGVEKISVASVSEAMRDMQSARLLISADGSIPHLASHFGATCAVIFGPNDASWRRPLGRHHVIIRHHTECAPCLMARCPLDHRCMTRLDLAGAKDALRPLLENC